jgi:uncharacterized protein YbjQ (UPF0145 family)|tara:strand:+ start:214 stop:384 length:171 start_codon:yes stop_codon:yes gene_type:complete
MLNTSKFHENDPLGLEVLKEITLQNLKENANKLGANAVVGIQLDKESVANSAALFV